MGRLEHGPSQRQLADEHQWKLKEHRLSELASQLETPEPHQHTPPQVHHPHTPQPSQRSHTSASIHRKPSLAALPSGTVLAVGREDSALWEQKRREADELNARIESLRLAGMPADQLPSPVHLPLDPLRADRHDLHGASLGRRTCASSPGPPSHSYGADHGPRRQPSRKSLHTPSPYVSSRSPGVARGVGRRTPSSSEGAGESQARYLSALKDAEDLINQLRGSHDRLLTKVTQLERQLDAADAEADDLRTRTGRLEGFLAEEQKARERVEAENEQLRMRLEAHVRAQARGHPDAQPRTHAPSRAQRMHPDLPEHAYHAQPLGEHHGARLLRAQLAERDERLQRQFVHPELDLHLDPSGRAPLNGAKLTHTPGLHRSPSTGVAQHRYPPMHGPHDHLLMTEGQHRYQNDQDLHGHQHHPIYTPVDTWRRDC